MSATEHVGASLVDQVRDRLAVPPPAYLGKQWQFLVCYVVAVLLVPLFYGGNLYRDGLLNQALIYSILALGFYWCFAIAGQFSFAAFAMYAAGAYFSSWAAHHWGGTYVGLIVAMVVTGAIGALTMLLFSRLPQMYFAIATLAVGSLLIIVFRQWESFTGGFAGTEAQMPSFFGRQLSTYHDRYYLIAAVAVLLLAATVAVIRSPAMRELTLSRDNAPVAATAGLRPSRLKLIAFTVGSGMEGIAGALYAHNAGYFSLDSFPVDVSLDTLLMVLLGGAASMYGPSIGAIVIVALPEILRNYDKYSDLIYALLVLVVIVAFPGGIADCRRLAVMWIRRARRR